MKISVTMAFRNEEKNLPRFLAMTQWADEIILGNHHSTPGSVKVIKDIAPKMPIKIIDFPEETIYRHGFSFIKNQLLNECCGDWIVALDADEIIVCDRCTIEKDLANIPADYNGLCLNMTHVNQGKRELKTRIFRNDGTRWRGLIHEELFPTPRQMFSINMEIIHYGKVKKKYCEKNGLYAELLLRLVEHPELRMGTNREWWTTYYVENKEQLHLDRQQYYEGRK